MGPAAAKILGSWPFSTRPIRDITIGTEISVASANALIGDNPKEDECDRPLSLSLPTLKPNVAHALVKHTNELFLTISRQIVDEDLVSVLMSFNGRRLFLEPRQGLTSRAERALFSSPQSKVTVLFEQLVVTN